MLRPADAAFLDALEARMPPGRLAPLEPRHRDEPRGRWKSAAVAVALPCSTQEVTTIVSACADARVGLVPWGGGTGLVGGQIAPAEPATLMISLEKMNASRGIWPQERVLAIEAGATLAKAQAEADSVGLHFPLALASQGSATVGGVLATNAGGVHVLRHGNARDLCLGIEVVLADGSVLHGLKRLRKDNSGYDLRHLLIGSEGTLGIITAATLRLVSPPVATGAAMLVVQDPAAALRLLSLIDAQIPGCVSAFELIGRTGFEFLREALPQIRQPFAQPPEWSVLIELGLPTGIAPQPRLEAVFEAALAEGLVSDGVIARSDAERTAFWRVRESIPEANRRIGSVSSHDISLPLSEVAGFIAEAGPALARLGEWRINCFGHLGDGNLHYNVFARAGGNRLDHEALREAIKTCVHDLVHARGGSVSAEHGIGRLKVGDLARYGDPAKLAALRAIKAALDPVGILNPGALFA